MNTYTITNQSAHRLLKISKIVVVLLLLLVPTIALAKSTQPSSGSKHANPILGEQPYHAEPVSYQMTNTSAYKVSTTYNPAQTVYTPFSDETPSTNNSGNNGMTGRKKSIPNPGNPGQTEKETEPPIGEPWIMLAFAAMAAVVITLRKKQTA
jgi:hypothetical protein